MDKVFSTRLDESVVPRIGLLAQQLGMTKKAIIETAIQMLGGYGVTAKNPTICLQTLTIARSVDMSSKRCF